MKSQFMMSVLIFVLLVACASQGSVPSEVTATLPSPTETPIPTSTEVPLEALPVEELVQKYLAEEIDDISFLTFPQRQSFAIALDEERDNQRGANPVIWTDEVGKQFYIDPITGDFLTVNNGTTAEQQTIDNTLPKVVDDEGYTHVFYNGAWIKIEGSQNIQYDDFENFPWPNTELTKVLDEKDQHPLTMPEWMFKVSDGSQMSMLPIFILSKEIGEFNIVDWGDTGTLTVYVPHENDPYSVSVSILIGSPTLYADGVTARSAGKIDEFTTFWKTLEEDTVYYLVIFTDQKTGVARTYPSTNGQEITAPYQGLAPTDSTTDIITGKTESNKITLIDTSTLVKKRGD